MIKYTKGTISSAFLTSLSSSSPLPPSPLLSPLRMMATALARRYSTRLVTSSSTIFCIYSRSARPFVVDVRLNKLQFRATDAPKHHMTCRSRAFSTTATKPAEESTSISNRAAFQSLPVIPSILAHIEKIGVGIRSKPSLSRKRRSNVTTKRSKPSFDDTLNDAEEVEFFANREREHSSSWRDRRAQTVSTALGKKKRGVAQKVKTTTIPETSGSYWLPPPPFSSFSRSNNNITKQSNGQQVLKDLKFTRRPVKCLGKAGSMKDKLPLESKGLSEIAIIGRSNVGKSTVLNALLYGNTDESLSQRRFQRGRTPQGAKLPKGVKATTSHKPGETKELSFYQITADVEINSEDGVTSTADRESESNLNKQLSKMSLLLVDLPGYGFAFAKEERTKEWQELMHHYLLERRSLKRILLLLDARHGFKQTDFEFREHLDIVESSTCCLCAANIILCAQLAISRMVFYRKIVLEK